MHCLQEHATGFRHEPAEFNERLSPDFFKIQFNPLNAELNPICCLLALLGVNDFLHVSKGKG